MQRNLSERKDPALFLADNTAFECTGKNRAGKVIRITPVKHYQRDMAALDNTGSDDIEHGIGSCSETGAANDVEQLFWCQRFESFCFFVLFGISRINAID